LCLRNISLSTQGVIFMGTPELDSRLSSLQTFMETNPTAENESSSTQNEARWMLDTLQQYSTISTNFKTLYAYESPNTPSQVRTTPRSDFNSYQLTQLKKSTSSMSQRLTPSIMINATHGNMIKFESSLDESYIKIKENINEIVLSAKQSGLSEKK
jgi:hypothetical protein